MNKKKVPTYISESHEIIKSIFNNRPLTQLSVQTQSIKLPIYQAHKVELFPRDDSCLQ